MSTGIDGAAELTAWLEAATGNPAAEGAPRDRSLGRYLANGLALEEQRGEPGPLHSLTAALMSDLGIWWSPDAYQVMPVMTPWCVRDRSCRYDQGPEAWGSPRADGYLRDDNSIIKKLPLPVQVTARAGHPFAGRKPWRGFTACHIWRDLPGGAVAGEDPWLYSFMPNLVWLPTPLAPLTDRQDSWVQRALQRVSISLFSDVPVASAHAELAERCWAALPEPPGLASPVEARAFFTPEPAFFKRRVTYLRLFASAAGDVTAGRPLTRRVICSRYTEGMPTLASSAVSAFGMEMALYADRTEAALQQRALRA